MTFRVALRGRGRVEVAAHGLADAEHRVDKELRALWPDARVEVLEVRRPDGPPRIVEELAVSYRLHATLSVEASGRDAAPAEAFRLARGRLHGTRYARTEFEAVGAPTVEPLP